jgi:hypothetical protein
MEGLFLGDQHGLTSAKKQKYPTIMKTEKENNQFKVPYKNKELLRLPLWRAPRV